MTGCLKARDSGIAVAQALRTAQQLCETAHGALAQQFGTRLIERFRFREHQRIGPLQRHGVRAMPQPARQLFNRTRLPLPCRTSPGAHNAQAAQHGQRREEVQVVRRQRAPRAVVQQLQPGGLAHGLRRRAHEGTSSAHSKPCKRAQTASCCITPVPPRHGAAAGQASGGAGALTSGRAALHNHCSARR